MADFRVETGKIQDELVHFRVSVRVRICKTQNKIKKQGMSVDTDTNVKEVPMSKARAMGEAK